MSSPQNVIPFPADRAVAPGHEPGTWLVHLYWRAAYRTAHALWRGEGVCPEEAEPVIVPAGARVIFRLGEAGRVFTSFADAAAALRGAAAGEEARPLLVVGAPRL